MTVTKIWETTLVGIAYITVYYYPQKIFIELGMVPHKTGIFSTTFTTMH